MDKIGVLGYSIGGAGAMEAVAENPEINAIVCLSPGADETVHFESTRI